jgi:hypothetical protein
LSQAPKRDDGHKLEPVEKKEVPLIDEEHEEVTLLAKERDANV